MRVGLLAISLAMAIVAFGFSASAGPVGDMDSDGTVDPLDFCKLEGNAPSPCGLDTDMDGYGNCCDCDFNNDGVCDAGDSGIFLGDLSAGSDVSGTGTDMNCDGVVDAGDSGKFLTGLGVGTPGPSGLSCAGSVPCP